MSQTIETPEQPQVVEQKSSRGCLYGCLGVFLAMVLLGVCGGFGVYYFIAGQVEKYTSETPTELPVVKFTPEQIDQLDARLETFKEALDEGQPAEDLVLTADEINALINQEEHLRGKAFVRIDHGRVTGDISIPTDAIPGGDGRFFNASGSFDIKLDHGVLIVTLADAEVKGEQVPQEILDAMSKENLAKDLYKDPKNAEMISRFESVSIEGDKIILKLRRESQPDAEPKATEPKTAEPKTAEPKTAEPKTAEPKTAEPKSAEPSGSDRTGGPPAASEESPAESSAQPSGA